MLGGVFFVCKAYYLGLFQGEPNPDLLFENINIFLLFMGLGISFSSLQDPTKTQNNFSKKVWQDPKKGKYFIYLICATIVVTLITGLIGFFVTNEGILHELSVGAIVLSLGMFGLLKTAIEMFENHRLDKNPIKEN